MSVLSINCTIDPEILNQKCIAELICNDSLNKSLNYSDFIYCGSNYSITEGDEVIRLRLS